MENKCALVSAVITTHNRSEDVIKAIDSVKKQTYGNIQIIVVDDASTDATYSILHRFSGIEYIRIEPNDSKGGNHARNIGIQASCGQYVAFLDDDDQWYDTKIEKQLNLIKSNEKLGMVYCELRMDTGIKLLNYNVAFQSEGDVVNSKLFYKPMCSTSAMLIKKSILDDIGGFDEKVRYWQEYELTLRVIQKCLVGLVKEPLVLYSNSIKDKKKLTNNFNNWMESVNYIWEKHKDLFSKLDETGRKKQMEIFYSEAAIRASSVGLDKKMKEYYHEAYRLTGKLEYLIRWKTGITRKQTRVIEDILKKIIYIKNKR